MPRTGDMLFSTAMSSTCTRLEANRNLTGNLTPRRAREPALTKERGVLLRSALAVLIGLAVSACVQFTISDPGLGTGIGVRNETDLTLSFRLLVGNTWYDLAPEAGPRQTALLLDSGDAFLEGHCTTGDLIATAPDGAEVAHHAPPLCVDDLWVIDSPASSSSP